MYDRWVNCSAAIYQRSVSKEQTEKLPRHLFGSKKKENVHALIWIRASARLAAYGRYGHLVPLKDGVTVLE